jgi:hypothetical protein
MLKIFLIMLLSWILFVLGMIWSSIEVLAYYIGNNPINYWCFSLIILAVILTVIAYIYANVMKNKQIDNKISERYTYKYPKEL